MAHASGPSDEDSTIEFKERFDPTNRGAELKLIREVAAFANSGGGTIVIGRRDDGVVIGVDEATVRALDPAKVCSKVESFITPETLEITVRVDRHDELQTVSLVVPAFAHPPLVMAKDGTWGSGTAQATIFRKGDVYVRRGTKAEPARRTDFTRWTEERVEAARSSLLANLNFVANLPPGAEVAMVVGDEEIDEPNAMLRRAARLWERNHEKLLTATELASLLLTNSELQFDHPADTLVVHSALRKRTTLWHWMERIERDAAWLMDVFAETIAGSDRDKSDAGRSIIDLAAVFLDPAMFGEVRDALSRSTYKHFRKAADGADQAGVVDRLHQQRTSASFGEPLSEWSTSDLRTETRHLSQVLLGAGRHTSEQRRLSQIGLELFARTERGSMLSRPPVG